MFIEAQGDAVQTYPFVEALYPHKPCKPDLRKPAHQKKMEQVLQSPEFIYEEKLDGVSILMIGGRAFTIRDSKETGYPSEKTEALSTICDYLKNLFGPYLILDGEAWKRGWKSNHVTSILNSNPDLAISKQEQRGYLEYHVYDIMRLPNGSWINNLPFERRRAHLEDLCTRIDHPLIKLNPVYSDMTTAQQFFDRTIADGGEGIVIKAKQGKYEFNKRPMWNMIKMKASEEFDAVIVGFQPPTKEYTGANVDTWPFFEDGVPVTKHWYHKLIGTVDIGVYKGDELVTIGTITGLTDSIREDMTHNPEKYIGEVCKVKMMETNETGGLRHAFFRGMHGDKNAKDCRG